MNGAHLPKRVGQCAGRVFSTCSRRAGTGPVLPRSSAKASLDSDPRAVGPHPADAAKLTVAWSSAISAATLGRCFTRKCVAPSRALIVPKGCSIVSHRTLIRPGFASSRVWTSSIRCSCAQRVIRRFLRRRALPLHRAGALTNCSMVPACLKRCQDGAFARAQPHRMRGIMSELRRSSARIRLHKAGATKTTEIRSFSLHR